MKVVRVLWTLRLVKNNMVKEKNKVLSPVERLVSSLESRIKTYNKNKEALTEEYSQKIAVQDQKISDAKLQLNALKK